MIKTEDWFKLKKYPHIGMPLLEKDKDWVDKYIRDEKKISTHSFHPFIHRAIKARKFRKEYDDETDVVLNDGMRKKKDPKTRDIYYANHLDANVFSYYSNLLTELYEKELKDRNLCEVVTAYRKIKQRNTQRGKNNVDFAEDVFRFIKKSKEINLVATTFDIKGFFDNLNHEKIKDSWKKLLKCSELPEDHYNVYKNIINFSYVEINDLLNEFHNDLIQKKVDGKIQKRLVSDLKYFREKDIVAFCELKDFKTRIRNNKLIKANKKIWNDEEKKYVIRKIGIPQGSPISALLANLYLLEFDSEINALVIQKKGMYRRYSDDIVIVCNNEDHDMLKQLVLSKICDFNLEIQIAKTNSYLFDKQSDRFYCSKILANSTLNNRKNLQYLGFDFDGKYVSLKSCSLAKFYRNMKKSVRCKAFYAQHSQYKQDKGKIFRRRLYARFSYIGAKRKMHWIYDKDKKTYIKTVKHDWGNFITYAYMAHNNMKDSKIRKQLRNHWEILNQLIIKGEISQISTPTENTELVPSSHEDE